MGVTATDFELKEAWEKRGLGKAGFGAWRRPVEEPLGNDPCPSCAALPVKARRHDSQI